MPSLARTAPPLPGAPSGRGALACAAALLLPALNGCRGTGETGSPPAPSPASSPAPPVEVSLLEESGRPRFGDLVDLRVQVGNGGVHPILLREIEIAGQLPEPTAWLERRRGLLRRSGDGVLWRALGAGQTEPVFARGLLFPAETIRAPVLVRARSSELVITVRWQEVPQARLGRDVLLPRPEDARFGARARVQFEAPDVSDTIAFRRAPPGDERRAVLVLDPASVPLRSRTVREPLGIADPETAAAVLDELGLPGGEVSRWETGGVWLARVPGERELHLLPGDGAPSRRIPRVPFAVFDAADLAGLRGEDLLVVDRSAGGAPQAKPPPALLGLLEEAFAAGRSVRVGLVDPHGPGRRPAVVLR